MEVGGCCFPDELLYDGEGLVWVRLENDTFSLGPTQLQAFVVGRVNSLLPKPAGFEAARERSIAFVETVTYSGNVRTPLSGVVEQVNNEVIENPSLINSDPYGRGWIARLRPLDLPAERMHLSRSEGVKEAAEKTIQERGLRCFSIYPTYRVSGIG